MNCLCYHKQQWKQLWDEAAGKVKFSGYKVKKKKKKESRMRANCCINLHFPQQRPSFLCHVQGMSTWRNLRSVVILGCANRSWNQCDSTHLDSSSDYDCCQDSSSGSVVVVSIPSTKAFDANICEVTQSCPKSHCKLPQVFHHTKCDRFPDRT